MVNSELKIKRINTEQILIELEGSETDIAIMLVQAMEKSIDLTVIICGSIPTLLDKKGISRESYCKTVMDAVGLKK